MQAAKAKTSSTMAEKELKGYECEEESESEERRMGRLEQK